MTRRGGDAADAHEHRGERELGNDAPIGGRRSECRADAGGRRDARGQSEQQARQACRLMTSTGPSNTAVSAAKPSRGKPHVARTASSRRSSSGAEERIGGSASKLWRGGGEAVAHSSVVPAPRIVAGGGRLGAASRRRCEEDQRSPSAMMNAPIGREVQRPPARERRVVGDAPRHPVVAEDEHRDERQVRADAQQPEVDLAEALAQAAPRSSSGTSSRARRRAPKRLPREQRVVEVRDHDVGSCDVVVERRRGDRDAASARRSGTATRKPSANSIEVVKRIAPPPHRRRACRSTRCRRAPRAPWR